MQRQRNKNLDHDIERPYKGQEDTLDAKYGSKKSSINPRTFFFILIFLSLAIFLWTTALSSWSLPETGEEKKKNIQIKPKTRRTETHEPESPRVITPKSFVSFLDGDESQPIGYIRRPQVMNLDSNIDLPNEEDSRLHLIFSSGCNYFQHWQSELLLSSAKQVGQHGRITRIVSGCYDKKAEKTNHKHQTFPKGKNDLLVPIEELNRSTNEDFGLFITPQFEGAVDFPWINKPNSIDYFLNTNPYYNDLDSTNRDDVIVILDPDFIFLKPFLIYPESEHIIATRDQPIEFVSDGHPIGQRYGLEGGWVSRFSPVEKKITKNASSLSKDYTTRMASKYTSVGPPMILTIRDMKSLASLWKKYMKPVLDVGGPDILADMWAYSIAAADLDLKHVIHDQYMISTEGHHGQAYPFLEKFEHMSCNDPASSNGPDVIWPNFIHYASNFKAYVPPSLLHADDLALVSEKDGYIEYMFHKGHVPATILDCDSPFIIQPPDELFNWVLAGNYKGLKSYNSNHQSAWVVCNILSRLNYMLKEYKEKFCEAESEDRYLIRLIQKKTKQRGCSQSKDKWCYPLAQIEGIDDEELLDS